MAVSGHPTRSVFDRYPIRVEEQTGAALRRATDYTTLLRQQKRTVVPLNDRRARQWPARYHRHGTTLFQERGNSKCAEF
jgi:hypothetical protein